MISVQDFIKQCSFITVLYNKKWTDAAVLCSFEDIGRETSCKLDVIIADNSPAMNPEIPVGNYCRYNYIANETNTGVSASYNRAADLSEKPGKKWLFFTDSDFQFDFKLLSAYVNAINSNDGCHLFCPVLKCGNDIISPYIKKYHRSIIQKSIQAGIVASDKYIIINNGICCTIEAFNKAGGYDPCIALDFSDDYFIYRYSLLYPEFFVIDAVVRHKLSAYEKHSADSALQRFAYYCSGAFHMAKLFRDGYWFYFWGIMRMLKLSLDYKTIRFAIVYIHELEKLRKK